MSPCNGKVLDTVCVLMVCLFSFLHCMREGGVGVEPSECAQVQIRTLEKIARSAAVEIDSIRFTIHVDEPPLVLVRTFAYATRQGSFPSLPCGTGATIRLEAFSAQGEIKFTGMHRVDNLSCGALTIAIEPHELTPLAPTRLTTRVLAYDAVELQWQDNAHNDDSVLIERSVEAVLDYRRIGMVAGETNFVDSHLSPSTTYRYRLSAHNAAGASPVVESGPVVTLNYDSLPPRISILSHAARDTVHSRTIKLYGAVEDVSGVDSLIVDSVALAFDNGFWVVDSVTIGAPGDSTVVTLEAVDKSRQRNRISQSYTFFYQPAYVDTIAPRIEVRSHTSGDTVYSAVVSLFGTVGDASGIQRFSVNDSVLRLDDFYWHYTAFVLQPGRNRISLTAVDSSEGQNPKTQSLVLYYVDPCADTIPPHLSVISHALRDTVSTRVAWLFGTASDNNHVEKLTINDSLLTVQGTFWDAGGVALDTGENRFVLRAIDGCASPDTTEVVVLLWYSEGYVDSANHAPAFTVTPASLTAALKAEQEYVRPLAATDADPYNALSYAVKEPLSLVGDSLLRWTPGLGDIGVHTFYAVVYDQDSARDSISWTITVIDPRLNSAPRFVSRVVDMSDSVAITVPYLDTLQASDEEQDSGLVYSLIAAPEGMSIDSARGIVSWIPDAPKRGIHHITARVFDDSLASASLSWVVTVYDPTLPVVNAGVDTTVSIRDSLHLHGTARSINGAIVDYAWSIGGSPFRPIGSGDTSFVAPAAENLNLVCVLRVIDQLNKQNTDTVVVRVLRDAPLAKAGNDTIVAVGAPFVLRGTGSDGYGPIVRYEWDIGKRGVFEPSADGSYSGTAPEQDSNLVCVLRVVDNDSIMVTDEVVVHAVGMTMRLIYPGASGDHVVGSIGSGAGDGDEKPVHEVALSPYLIDTTEVTQAEYQSLMKVNPSSVLGANLPVDKATWFDAVLFCNARSVRDGFEKVYSYTSVEGEPGNGCTNLGNLTINYNAIGYRLPTEAEWEYACRADSMSAYYWGANQALASQYAWFVTNASSKAHDVGTKLPNALNLYDMIGNVREWCNDWYEPGWYASSPRENPRGPASGVTRVTRGGSWQDNAGALSSSNRDFGIPSWSSSFVGFRCVLPAR